MSKEILKYIKAVDKRGILILLLSLFMMTVQAQTAHEYLKEGDKNFDQGEFDLAENAYRQASKDGRENQSHFNLGNALYLQGEYEAAAQEFDEAANFSKTKEERARALYNKGNAMYMAQKLDESLKAYKESLVLNPKDAQAKENFLRALQMKKQQQQQQSDQQQEENQDQQDQENQQQNQEQNQENQQEENQDNNNQQQQEQENQEEENKEGESEKEQQESSQENALGEGEEGDAEEEKEALDKQEALRLLESVELSDNEVQGKLKKSSNEKSKPKKNW